MAKYSTNSSGGGGDSDVCALCGEENSSTRRVKLEGAEVFACRDCKPSDEDDIVDQDDGNQRDSSPPGSGDTPGYTISQTDSSWAEENPPEYGNTETPYLVNNYADDVTVAREEQGLSTGELAEQAEVPEDAVISLEKGDAISDDVGKAIVEAIEDVLGIEIQEEF